MAGMKRFVTYIYAYEEEKKGSNVGFARIEIRGQDARIEIHLRGVYAASAACRVYLFQREASGGKEATGVTGVLVGEMKLANGSGDGIVVLKGGTIKKGDEVTMIPANFYATVRDRNKAADTLTATVITGKNRGEKLCMMDGKIRAVRSSGAGMYHGLHKHDMNEEAKESISGSDFFNEKHAEEIWKAHLTDKHRITIEEQEIFLHSIGNRARLVICGGGHVSTALVRMAKLLDFEIWVLEDRPFFAEHAKQEGADHILCGDYVESLAKIPKDVDNYYVCMTRGHRFDLECLKEIYKRTFAYAGMMGSRKRSVLVRKDLEESGYTKEQVQKLHSPIGLAIGAQTPAEIALSVISEIVQCKNERAKAAETDEAILEEQSRRDFQNLQ